MRRPAELAGRALRGVGALALLLCLIVAGAVAAQEEAPAAGISGPRAHAPRRVVDLGVVPMGAQGQARFAIRNVGSETLVIHAVDTSCDCTVADYDGSIPPGGIGYIEVSLLTEELDGQVTKGIVARTNDPENASVSFTLKAVVESRLKVLPQPVVFIRERAREGTVGRALIRPTPEHAEAFTITELRSSSDVLVASASKLEQARPRGGGLPVGYPGDWLLEIRFRDDMPVAGPLKARVRFRTGLAEQPAMGVAVESNLSPSVTLSTDRLVLTPAEGGPRGTLFASVRNGLDATALEVESHPSELAVRLEAATERMFKVDVRWQGQALEGGELRFGVGGSWVRLPVTLPGG